MTAVCYNDTIRVDRHKVEGQKDIHPTPPPHTLLDGPPFLERKISITCLLQERRDKKVFERNAAAFSAQSSTAFLNGQTVGSRIGHDIHPIGAKRATSHRRILGQVAAQQLTHTLCMGAKDLGSSAADVSWRRL
ncbi:hypothetical protein AOLI_G00278180 [Acnodon oligacanthus]